MSVVNNLVESGQLGSFVRRGAVLFVLLEVRRPCDEGVVSVLVVTCAYESNLWARSSPIGPQAANPPSQYPHRWHEEATTSLRRRVLVINPSCCEVDQHGVVVRWVEDSKIEQRQTQRFILF